MIRDDDIEGPMPGVARSDLLDSRLQSAFDEAFVQDMPVDVEARHLWQLYRSARPSPVDGLSAAPRPGRLRRMAVSATLGLVALVFPGLIGQASLDALPGDVLYPAKRQYEQVQLSTAVSWAQRDEMLMDQAELRLLEAQSVARLRPRQLSRVVAQADRAIQKLEDSPEPASRARARNIRSEATRQLTALVDVVDERSRNDLLVAIDEIADQGGTRLRVVRSRETPAATQQVASAESSAPADGSNDGDEPPDAAQAMASEGSQSLELQGPRPTASPRPDASAPSGPDEATTEDGDPTEDRLVAGAGTVCPPTVSDEHAMADDAVADDVTDTTASGGVALADVSTTPAATATEADTKPGTITPESATVTAPDDTAPHDTTPDVASSATPETSASANDTGAACPGTPVEDSSADAPLDGDVPAGDDEGTGEPASGGDASHDEGGDEADLPADADTPAGVEPASPSTEPSSDGSTPVLAAGGGSEEPEAPDTDHVTPKATPTPVPTPTPTPAPTAGGSTAPPAGVAAGEIPTPESGAATASPPSASGSTATTSQAPTPEMSVTPAPTTSEPTASTDPTARPTPTEVPTREVSTPPDATADDEAHPKIGATTGVSTP